MDIESQLAFLIPNFASPAYIRDSAVPPQEDKNLDPVQALYVFILQTSLAVLMSVVKIRQMLMVVDELLMFMDMAVFSGKRRFMLVVMMQVIMTVLVLMGLHHMLMDMAMAFRDDEVGAQQHDEGGQDEGGGHGCPEQGKGDDDSDEGCSGVVSAGP